jgi:hypothetical protein
LRCNNNRHRGRNPSSLRRAAGSEKRRGQTIFDAVFLDFDPFRFENAGCSGALRRASIRRAGRFFPGPPGIISSFLHVRDLRAFLDRERAAMNQEPWMPEAFRSGKAETDRDP